MNWEDFQALFPDGDYSEVFDDSTITELLETGSVTVNVRGQAFVVTVQVDRVVQVSGRGNDDIDP